MAHPEQNNRERPTDVNPQELRSSRPGDLPDSPRDMEKLKNEETYIDLPDVSDIPGQENITVPPAGILGDTTIASDDEESVSVFGRADQDALIDDRDADVTIANHNNPSAAPRKEDEETRNGSRADDRTRE